MMVRINLVPGKKRASASEVLWKVMAVMAILLIAELVLMYFAWSAKDEEVTKRNQELQQAQQQIDRLKAENVNLAGIEKQNEELLKRERALQELAAIRVGPQYLLDELKSLLSLPTTRAAIKQARKDGWNVAWEASNVFLESFVEVEPGTVRIVGDARTLDDVAEFWLRLRTSDLFQNVRLAGIEERKVQELETPLQRFEFFAKANFYYQTEAGVKLLEKLQTAGAEPDPAGGGEPTDSPQPR